MARKNDTTDILDMIAVMEPEGRPLKGMRICITGHLAKPRKEWNDIIIAAGGIVQDGVKYDTTHLVTNEDWTTGSIKGKVSSKYAAAQRQRTKIISEQALLDIIIKGDTSARTGQG